MPFLFLDIETNGLDPFTCELVTLQLLTESGEKFIVVDDEEIKELKEVLENNVIVGQNIKFDSKFLKVHYGITLYHVYDTYIAEIAISGGLLASRKGASLKDLALKYCGVNLDKSAQCTFKKGQELTTEQVEYTINDLLYLPEIMKQQKAKIRALGIQKTIEIEMKALPAVVWLELSGIFVNIEKINDIRKQVIESKEKAESYLSQVFQEGTGQRTITGEEIQTEINLNSPTQLLKALQKRGYKISSTSSEALSELESDDITKAIEEYRAASKMLSGFVDALPKEINPVTGRVHSSFSQYGAKSGRFTSRGPNLQQQPKSYDWRDIFQAERGNKLVTADYSQIELRILGQVAKDKEYIRAYNEGQDLHKLTASKVFGLSLEEVTKEKRSIAKTVNFGIAYGMWTGGLRGNMNKAGISLGEEEAKAIIKGFHKSYKQVSSYLDRVSNEGLKKLFLHNAAGRLIKFNPPNNDREEGNIKRESKNLPIQSLCADMLKIAVGELFLKLEPMGVKFVNTVHDEIVLECSEAQADTVAMILQTEMEKAGKQFLKDMPCIAETVISDKWEK